VEFTIEGLIYKGPVIDVSDDQTVIPSSYQSLLNSINGFVAWNGGLHIRGLCNSPGWHSLWQVWKGPQAFHTLYENVKFTDIPFAQDALGDQYLIRDNQIFHLAAETGDLELKAEGFKQFLENVSKNPMEYLLLHPLQQFLKEGKDLAPGELIMAYPPFCTQESAEGVSLKTVPAQELILFHADFARKLPKDGQKVRVEIDD